jgi:hypothetical protein
MYGVFNLEKGSHSQACEGCGLCGWEGVKGKALIFIPAPRNSIPVYVLNYEEW